VDYCDLCVQMPEGIPILTSRIYIKIQLLNDHIMLSVHKTQNIFVIFICTMTGSKD